MRASVAALVLLSALFAGCVGGDSEADPTETVPTEATVDGSTGGIEGVVTDDELLPISDAQIAIPGIADSVRTDAGGAFAFSKLQPGDYNLAASRLGYFGQTKKIGVKAGEVSRADIVLQRIPIMEPLHNETIKFSDTLPASNACAEREAYDAGDVEPWPEQSRGVTWQSYKVPVNASKADGTDLLGVRMIVDLKHQQSDATVDIDIRLFDAKGTKVGDGWSEGADENIDVKKVLLVGDYTLFVCYYAGVQAAYKITATITYEQGDRAKYLRENPKEIEYPDE